MNPTNNSDAPLAAASDPPEPAAGRAGPSLIDVGELAKFLQALDSRAKQFIFYSLDHGGTCVQRVGSMTDRPMLKWAQDQQHQGRSLYVTAQEMLGRRRLNSEVRRFRCLFADFDSGLPSRKLTLEPMLVQTSEGRYQAVWTVDAAGPQLSEEQWRGMCRRLAQDYGADLNAAKPAQGLRLPGTLNLKPDRNRFRVTIVNESCTPYTARQLLDAFPPIADPEPAFNARPYGIGETRPQLTDAMQRRHRAYFDRALADDVAALAAVPGGSRHDTLWRRACRFGKYVHHKIATQDELTSALMGACVANGYAKDDGQRAVLDTIRGAIKLSASDRLEDLPERPRATRAKPAASVTKPAADGGIEWPETSKAGGGPRARSQRNIRAFLEHAGVAVKFNNFDRRASATIDGTEEPLTDALMRRLRLEADELGLGSPKDFFDDVVLDLARRNSFHPVRDWLSTLRHDGEPRLDRWLTTYLGCEDSDLTRACGRKHLIAAVRRVRQPGEKHDACLVFEGSQGAGKSSAIRTLAGDAWFTDSLNIGDDAKGVSEQTAGAWLVELAELSGIRRSEVEQVKTMISRQSDRARAAYDKFVSDVPRQFVLFGTVNESEYLRDATGNRRFWPVRVGLIDLSALARDRDQIWAEAAEYEAAGETTGLPEQLWADAAAEQEKRLLIHPWQEKLEPLLEGKTGCVSMPVIWARLDVKGDRQDGNAGQCLSRIMTLLGFSRARRRADGKNVWCYANTPETRWIVF